MINPHVRSVIVIGGGPAGLMAAEILSQQGVQVDLYDAMPSVGRKFLLAGKGGLNLTHSENSERFLSRYGSRQKQVSPWLDGFGPEALRSWAQELGIKTFIGSSGRVFPAEMKAAPLLRAWLHRLRSDGVRFHMRHRWQGWNETGSLRFLTPEGDKLVNTGAVVLALGGGSWARLGSNGAWVPILEQRGIEISALRPANCGFVVNWSEHFRTRFAGHPLKSVIVTCTDKDGNTLAKQGEFMLTEAGVEGSLIYALSANLRDEIEATGAVTLYLDLLPNKELSFIVTELARPRGSRSVSSHLQSRLGIKDVKAGLLRECARAEDYADPERLGKAIKALPVRLTAPRPIDEAISSAGGVKFEMLDENLMIQAMPGVFCAGEMVDWEAPTGGYLLTASFASGRAAGCGVLSWLKKSAKEL